MDDDALAALVAADLRRNLAQRPQNAHEVYGFCLWVDDFYGEFLASFATEEWFAHHRQFRAHASEPDETIRSIAGLRWSIGDWHRFPDDDFVSPRTMAALEPLRQHLQDERLSHDEFENETSRWRELAFTALALAEPLDLLHTTEDAIAFVGAGDSGPAEALELMARTVPRELLPRLIRAAG